MPTDGDDSAWREALLDVGLDAVDALVGEGPRHGCEQADRLEQVAGDDGQHHVELEVAGASAEGDRGVVADDLRHDLADRLGHDRVDLARHDRRTRLQVGNVDLHETGARTRTHPAQVVGDLVQRDRDGAGYARRLDQRVTGGLRFEMVTGFGEWQPLVPLGDAGDDAGRRNLAGS